MIWILRRGIDGIDWILRLLIRVRYRLAQIIIRRKSTTEDPDREREILNKCDSPAETRVFRAILRASKSGASKADVQRGEHEGD